MLRVRDAALPKAYFRIRSFSFRRLGYGDVEGVDLERTEKGSQIDYRGRLSWGKFCGYNLEIEILQGRKEICMRWSNLST